MDRIDVRGAQPLWHERAGAACAAVPARTAAHDLEVEGEVRRDHPASPLEAQREVVAVGPELELEVALAGAEQEELDDLEFPEPVAAARWRGRGRVAVGRRLDVDLERVAERQVDPCALAGRERRAVPRAANLEPEARHAYTPPAPEDGQGAGRDVRAGAGEAGSGAGAAAAGEQAGEWLHADDNRILPAPVRAAWRELAGPLALRPLHGGLLHQSFHVRAGGVEYVLQRVADVFAPAIHENIAAVTEHLLARGLRAARLLPTRAGERSAATTGHGRWRLMEHLGGVSFERLDSPAQARTAGRLVGRFHAALADFDRPLAPMGIPYRDTPRYLASLRAALAAHRDHRLHAPARRLADAVFAGFDALGPPPAVRERVIHADLKASNLLFEGATGAARERAFALVDFDTLMRGTLWMELGDAWRSWCNAAGEDASAPRFDLGLFAASCEGFAAGYAAPLDAAERDSLEAAPERITLELCARFTADALEERYFGWDADRFGSRGEHNLARAEGQWQLYEAERATRARRRELLRRLGLPAPGSES